MKTPGHNFTKSDRFGNGLLSSMGPHGVHAVPLDFIPAVRGKEWI